MPESRVLHSCRASSGQSGRPAGIRQGRLGLVCLPRRAFSWLLFLYSRVVMSDPSQLPLLLVRGFALFGANTTQAPSAAPLAGWSVSSAFGRDKGDEPVSEQRPNVLRSGPNLPGGVSAPLLQLAAAVPSLAEHAERGLDFHDISFLTSGDVTIYFSRCS